MSAFIKVLFAIILALLLLDKTPLIYAGTTTRYPLTQAAPAGSLSCQQELSAVRESMFRSSVGEALLAKQFGDNATFNTYMGRAHVVLTSDELRPSSTTCTVNNLRTLRIMTADWEYEYLLDQAALFKLESR